MAGATCMDLEFEAEYEERLTSEELAQPVSAGHRADGRPAERLISRVTQLLLQSTPAQNAESKTSLETSASSFQSG